MRRRTTLRWIPVAALVLTSLIATAALPATSSAQGIDACVAVYPAPPGCPPPAVKLAGLNHIGWTYLNLNVCTLGPRCPAMMLPSFPGYRYTTSGWVGAELPGGWTYVYPYGGDFRWAWTQRTGWIAVRGGKFELRAF